MIQIQLDQFEGPLGLLLYLIRKNEMDIYDIEITKITAQYLEHVNVMKELDLEGAGDFVAMAASLIHIKSKMLLPQYNEAGEVVDEDPRKELVQRLVEYQKFQEMAKWLKDRPTLGRDNWRRGFREVWTDNQGAIVLDEGGLFAMIGLYRKVLKKLRDQVHVVMEKTQSIASRILELKDRLVPGKTLEFSDLMTVNEVAEKSRAKWVITFLSLLELGRLGFVSIFQTENYGQIHVTTKRVIEKDIVSQVDEFQHQEQTGLDSNFPTEATADQVSQQPSLFDTENLHESNSAATDDEIAAAEEKMDKEVSL